MKELTNGLVAKLMDDFMADEVYEKVGDEDLADMIWETWLAEGVPDGSFYADCVADYGNQYDFDELKTLFIDLLKMARIDLSVFREYAQEKIREDFLEMCDKSLDFTL